MAFRPRARGSSYRDAVRLLGRDELAIVKVIDRLGSVAVAAASVGTLGALPFFDVRDELVRWGDDVVRTIRDQISGVSRFDRTQRLVAAHTVIAITSFYEALGELLDAPGNPIGLRDLELTEEDRLAILSDGATAGEGFEISARPRYRDLVDALLEISIALPEPQSPYYRTLRELRDYYALAARQLITFVEGLSCWEAVSETDQERVAERLTGLPEIALRRYEENYRRLAAEVPEFAVWVTLTDYRATRTAVERIGSELRDRLDSLNTGLAGVSDLMRQISVLGSADQARGDLITRYRAAIHASILSGADAPEGVVLPSLETAYVNPRCRVCESNDDARPADESWWADSEVVCEVQQVIVGVLTGPEATRTPLLVLGHPGAGKSVLTKMLAARLADTDFLPVRVELRSVPADALIQTQIEHAIRDMTGREISWPDLAESADGALPVVMLDGFDELLQATGVNRADYLEQVVQFQQREQELGRPVAVIVTSRTVVANRARVPNGSVILKLEPFMDDQVATWLEIWNETNAAAFAARGVRPFSPNAALAHRELAAQPLLLMMLALYDAGDNALQNADADLSRAELYEQLLADFARREVRKHQPHLDEDAERRQVEMELRRLAAVALAMFNRHAQVVTETELTKDLDILLPEPAVSVAAGLGKPLGTTQRVVGRFFFVHESRALRDGGREHAFEFLHATFGEFLVARTVVATLRELVKERAFNESRTTPTRLDDSFLWVALSFAVLVGSTAIVEFTTGLLRQLPSDEGTAISDLVTNLLREALYPQSARSFGDYEPVRRPVSARHAAFSCNLAVLAVLSADEPIEANDWNTSLWWSELLYHEWNGLRDTVRMIWRFDPGRRRRAERWAQREDNSPLQPYEGISSMAYGPIRLLGSGLQHFHGLTMPAHSEAGRNLRTAAFFGNVLDAPGGMTTILIPYYRYVGDNAASLIVEQDMIVPFGNLLLELRLAPFEEHGADLRLQLYERCLGIGLSRPGWQSILLQQLREDARHLGHQKIVELLHKSVRVGLNKPNTQAVLDVLEVLNGPLNDPANELFDTLRSILEDIEAGPDVHEKLDELAIELLE